MGFYGIPLTLFHLGVLLAALLGSSRGNGQRYAVNNSVNNGSDLVTLRVTLRGGQTIPASVAVQGALYNNPTPTLNCTECTGRDLKRSYRLESIKTDILRKLRLSAPPNTTGRRLPNVPVLDRMIHQLEIEGSTGQVCERPPNTGSEPDDDRMMTMKVIQFSKPDESQSTPPPQHASGFIYFRLPTADIRQSSQVIRANLGLYIRSVANASASSSQTPRYTWILVYRLGSGVTQDRFLIRKKKIALTSAETGQWYHFDVKTLVVGWIDGPDTNHGIVVHASDGRGEPLTVTAPRNEAEESHLPYLEIETLSQPTSDRQRRAFDLNCDESSAELRCCRYPLVVDFEAFGWDWIIVPKRYSAFYCSGECPFLYYQQNAHGHMVQQAKPEGSGMPCCAPKRVSSISMLYYDDNMNIVYGRLPGMVVDRCGCA